ncbi:MAG: IS1595 family transposase [Clostridium argentinense]|nr:IS1595 family transposase [Clostridium argentinense]
MIDVSKFNSLFELFEAFPDEKSCIVYLEQLFWSDEVISPFDETSKVYHLGNHRYMCKNTQKLFNVKIGTIFEGTKLSLRKWFAAIWLLASNKKGISSIQLSRDLGITQKTAWYILQKIRTCFICKNDGQLDGEIECDETFVGGKNKNRHWDKKVKNSQGRSFIDKTPVLGMLQRGGDVICRVVANTSRHQITPNILKFVKRTATLYTDEWQGYSEVSKMYSHYSVDHGKKQYVDGNVYTNTLEGFWSIFKRGIIGIYHKVSRKHLQLYVNEFVFRYNTRKISESSRFNLLLCNIKYKLTYQKIIA